MSAIVFENVSKRFILHHQKTRAFQDLVIGTVRRSRRNGSVEEFWALRDVSFEISPGEAVGFIGPNGAGKSTSLKLVARIFDPTSGHVRVNGRLNALIELGAGFHEDLTGRENIYLSGALLGLGRREIVARFDDIVAFSELERFIDTQVKHYSSGMQARLGFAIATCIESDILLIDEVLSVGDQDFQRKCMERILEIREAGTTIVFVSHVQQQVERLCDRALFIRGGRVMADGKPDEVFAKYEETREQAKEELRKRQSLQMEMGFFQAQFMSYAAPAEMRVDGRYALQVTICNESPHVWRAATGYDAVSVGYHWLDRLGNLHQWNGVATPLQHDVAPGEQVTMESPVIPPTVPGPYRLEFDLTCQGRGWFSRHGCACPQLQVQVLPPDSRASNEKVGADVTAAGM